MQRKRKRRLTPRSWSEDEWNEALIGGILCNPVYAGIPPFPAMVAEQTRVDVGVKLAKEIGLRQYLVNLLKKSMRSVCDE